MLNITNLIGYTWTGKESAAIDIVSLIGGQSSKTYNVTFISNGKEYKSIVAGSITNQSKYIRYDSTNVWEYNSSLVPISKWENENYKSIKFIDGVDVENQVLISWLKEYGILTISDEKFVTEDNLTYYTNKVKGYVQNYVPSYVEPYVEEYIAENVSQTNRITLNGTSGTLTEEQLKILNVSGSEIVRNNFIFSYAYTASNKKYYYSSYITNTYIEYYVIEISGSSWSYSQGKQIYANPSVSAQEILTKLKVGQTTYSIPQGDVISTADNTFTGSNTFNNGITVNGLASLNSAEITEDLSIKGTILDGEESEGENGQVLSSTVTGTKWINLPDPTIPVIELSGESGSLSEEQKEKLLTNNSSIIIHTSDDYGNKVYRYSNSDSEYKYYRAFDINTNISFYVISISKGESLSWSRVKYSDIVVNKEGTFTTKLQNIEIANNTYVIPQGDVISAADNNFTSINTFNNKTILKGELQDKNSNSGTNGQILYSTGNGVEWKDKPSVEAQYITLNGAAGTLNSVQLQTLTSSNRSYILLSSVIYRLYSIESNKRVYTCESFSDNAVGAAYINVNTTDGVWGLYTSTVQANVEWQEDSEELSSVAIGGVVFKVTPGDITSTQVEILEVD